MGDAKERLRLKFESETDIVIDEKTKAWEKYALWLERVNAEKIKNKIVKENNFIRDKIQNAFDILDEAISHKVPE